MLTQPQVQRYSTDSGLRDIMIAEKEVVLTRSVGYAISITPGLTASPKPISICMGI
jgi:hypothetical protein